MAGAAERIITGIIRDTVRAEVTSALDERVKPMRGDIDGLADTVRSMPNALRDLTKTVSGIRAEARISREREREGKRRPDIGRAITRACLLEYWGYDLGRKREEVAGEVFPGDLETLAMAKALDQPDNEQRQAALRDWIVERATTSPAQTSVAGWAAELVGAANYGVVRSLAPRSAYGQLTGHGARLTFAGNGTVRMVNRAASPLGSFFRGEASAIAVRSFAGGSTTAKPFSGGLICKATRELIKHSSPNAETVLRQALSESAAMEIDSILLGNAAGTAIQPPGILNGATAVTPASGGAATAAAADIGALLGAVNPTDPVFIARSDVWSRLIGLVPGYASLPFIASPYVAAATVGLIDGDDLWTGEGDQLDIQTREDATTHDADPALPLISSGGTRAVPTISDFQMALVAFRLLVDIGWGLRGTGRAASVSPVTW